MAIDFSRAYSFSQYFEMQIPADELVSDFGYRYEKTLLHLPESQREQGTGGLDVGRLLEILKRTRSSNEQTKREVLAAPIVQEIVLATDATLRIEVTINVTPQLQVGLIYPW